jgi:hypothetical protein
MDEENDVLAEIEAALDPDASTYRARLGLIHPETLARTLGLHVTTLKQWRQDRRGPNFVKIGKRVWYLFPDIRDWLEESKAMTTQRRDYRKNPEEDQVRPDKESTPVQHPTDNPGAKPEFDPNVPPTPPPPPPYPDDAPEEAEEAEEAEDDEAGRHKEDDQFDRKVPPENDDRD